MVRRLVTQILLFVVVGLVLWHRVDPVAIAVPAGLLIIGLLYAYIPKVDDTRTGLPGERAPGKLPGSPDKALIPELIRSRRKAKSDVEPPGENPAEPSGGPTADR